ncbi:uncharacterized protein LOC117822641 [Xyrichtys novacula]|uniref:Uncharacterized protein LOC117822641 n=1 Tax=Xyrichtys novacula TaxID=13765 RepID=A0AAV1FJM8_XYRNO|nr:uncharacterized protein LOC117822641 [Xyrichtys novacula]
MKILVCIFLPVAALVSTAPIRVRRENVLSFLENAHDTTTARTIHATSSAAIKITPTDPEKEQVSADNSEAKSRERFGTNGYADSVKDPDSHEAMNPAVMEKGPSQRRTGGTNTNNTGLKDVSSRPVQDLGSREHPGPAEAHRASVEQIDLNSQEGLTVGARDLVNLSGEQVNDGVSQGTNLRRWAPSPRVNGLNSLSAPGRRREVQDPDSLEENNGRPAPAGNRGNTDYDETKEVISSEVNPVASPGNIPSGLSIPAKSKAS